MAARPTSRESARAAMSAGLARLNDSGERTHCQDRPVPFADVRQSPAEAARLCGVGTPEECPLLALCEQFGFTEGLAAHDMVYGGRTWRKGAPVVSETAYQKRMLRSQNQREASRWD